jgi:hypothetical protein
MNEIDFDQLKVGEVIYRDGNQYYAGRIIETRNRDYLEHVVVRICDCRRFNASSPIRWTKYEAKHEQTIF